MQEKLMRLKAAMLGRLYQRNGLTEGAAVLFAVREHPQLEGYEAQISEGWKHEASKA